MKPYTAALGWALSPPLSVWDLLIFLTGQSSIGSAALGHSAPLYGG